MKSIWDKLIEAMILGCGTVASIAAYVDTGKPWISLCILTVTMIGGEGLERVRRISGKS